MDDVAKLLAIDEIRNLKARYFRLMDMRDFDAMAQVFCRDVVFDAREASGYLPVGGSWQGMEGGVTHGRDTIMAAIRRVLGEVTTAHHGHCHEVTVESPTEARGVIAMQDCARTLDRATLLWQGMGHYFERYRVEDGEWRIAETRLVRLFLDDVGAV